MEPIITVDELAEQLLGNAICEAIDELDVVLQYVDSDSGNDEYTTLETLWAEYYKPEVRESLSNIDVCQLGFVIALETNEKRFSLQIGMLGLLLIAAAFLPYEQMNAFFNVMVSLFGK